MNANIIAVHCALCIIVKVHSGVNRLLKPN